MTYFMTDLLLLSVVSETDKALVDLLDSLALIKRVALDFEKSRAPWIPSGKNVPRQTHPENLPTKKH